MAVVYTDPDVVLARYSPYEPIIDAFQADVIEGLQFLWRRNAQAVYRYYPQIPWETTSAVATVDGDNFAADYYEPLAVFPMITNGWRPSGAGSVSGSAAGDVELTIVLVGDKVKIEIDVYLDLTPVNSQIVAVAAGPAVTVSTMSIPATAVGDIWWRIKGALNGTGTGKFIALYVFSNYTENAPK